LAVHVFRTITLPLHMALCTQDAVDDNNPLDSPAAPTPHSGVGARAAKRLRQRERRKQKRQDMRSANQDSAAASVNLHVGLAMEGMAPLSDGVFYMEDHEDKSFSPKELNPILDVENKHSCPKTTTPSDAAPKRSACASFRGVDLAGRVEVYKPAEETFEDLSISSSTEEASEKPLHLSEGPRLCKASLQEDAMSMRFSRSETSESSGDGWTEETPGPALAAAFATGSVHCGSCEEAINRPRSFSLMQAMRSQLDVALADLDAGRSGNCREKLLGVIKLCSGLNPYLEAVHRPLSEPVQHLQQASQEVDWKEKFRNGETKHLFDPGMSCSSIVMRTLQFVSRLVGANRCLQLGLSTGEAALAVAEVLPAHGGVLVLEEDRFFVNFAQKHFRKSPYGSRISIQCGDGATLMKELQAGSDGDRFDIIFMDGNKSEYATYLDLIVSRKLLVPGGIIVVDEVLWKGGAYDASPLDDHGTKCRTCWRQSPWPSKLPDPEVASIMAAMNDCMARHAQLEPLVLPIHNGLSLLRYMPREGLQEAGGSRENNIHARETVLLQEGMPAKVPVSPEMLPQEAKTEDAVDDFYVFFGLPKRQSSAPAVLNTHGRRSWSPQFKPTASLDTLGSASAGLRHGLFGKQVPALRQVSGQALPSRQVSSSSHGSSFPPVPRRDSGSMQQRGWETPVQMWPATPDNSPIPSPRPQWLESPTRMLPWL